MRPSRMIVGVLTGLMLSLSGIAMAETYVVDQGHAGAADDNAGTAETPLKTIGKGVSVARAGDTVLVKAGRYAEGVDISRSGAEGSPITLKAAPGAEVIIFGGLELSEAAYINIDGLKFTWSPEVKSRRQFIGVSNSKHVSISNCEAYDRAEKEDWWGQGCAIGGSDHVVLRDSRFHHIDIGVALGGARDCVVENLEIGPWDHEDGLRMMKCERILVQNCHIQSEEVYRPGATHRRRGHIDGIQIIRKNDDITVRNCYIHHTAQGVTGFTDSFGRAWNEPRKNIRVEGNVILTNNRWQGISFYRVENPVIINNTVPVSRIEIGSVTGDRGVVKNNIAAIGSVSQKVGEADYNMWFEEVKRGTKVGAHDLVQVDPMFVRAPEGDYRQHPMGDYRLKAGSPAIDSADSSAGRGKDRNGNQAADAPSVPDKGTGPEPYLDRGALEYVPVKE